MCAVVSLLVALVATGARASPRDANAVEDAIASGDLDGDDLAARPSLASLPRGATAGRGVTPRRRGSAWVSLLGFARPALDASGTEIGASLVVGLPLERLVGRPEPAANASPKALHLVQVAGREREGGVVLSAPVARACVAAAWRNAGIGPDDARLDGIASRARWSAILPEARVRAVRGQDERASLETTADTNRLRGSSGADLAVEARLTWRLDRLLYADDEPAFERIRLERHDARMRIASRTLEALFHWQRAVVDLRTGAADVESAVRMAEAEATLDVLTGGWFSASVRDGVVVVPAIPVERPEAKGTPARDPAASGAGGT